MGFLHFKFTPLSRTVSLYDDSGVLNIGILDFLLDDTLI